MGGETRTGLGGWTGYSNRVKRVNRNRLRRGGLVRRGTEIGKEGERCRERGRNGVVDEVGRGTCMV